MRGIKVIKEPSISRGTHHYYSSVKSVHIHAPKIGRVGAIKSPHIRVAKAGRGTSPLKLKLNI